MYTPGLWLSADRAEVVTAPFTCGSSSRSPEAYQRTVDQFGVDVHPRYANAPGETWCNLFLSDVTRANGCEIPRSWRGHWLRARAQILWLRGELTQRELAIALPPKLLELQGPHHGWHECSEIHARDSAGRGWPTAVTWLAPSAGEPSHVGCVMPSRTAATMIAQAGGKRFAYGPLATGFGSRSVQFFTHA